MTAGNQAGGDPATAWRCELIKGLEGKGSAHGTLKNQLQAKDIVPGIDRDFLSRLKTRLLAILRVITDPLIRQGVLTSESRFAIHASLEAEWDSIGGDEAKLRKFNNQGRRPEEVLFSLMRGHMVERILVSLLSRGLGSAFQLQATGGDQIIAGREVARIASADYAIRKEEKEVLRIEMQSAFQSQELDLKVSKIAEGQRLLQETAVPTAVIMCDFNSGRIYWVSLRAVTVGEDGRTVTRPGGVLQAKASGRYEGVMVVPIADLQPDQGHLGEAADALRRLSASLLNITGEKGGK